MPGERGCWMYGEKDYVGRAERGVVRCAVLRCRKKRELTITRFLPFGQEIGGREPATNLIDWSDTSGTERRVSRRHGNRPGTSFSLSPMLDVSRIFSVSNAPW